MGNIKSEYERYRKESAAKESANKNDVKEKALPATPNMANEKEEARDFGHENSGKVLSWLILSLLSIFKYSYYVSFDGHRPCVTL